MYLVEKVAYKKKCPQQEVIPLLRTFLLIRWPIFLEQTRGGLRKQDAKYQFYTAISESLTFQLLIRNIIPQGESRFNKARKLRRSYRIWLRIPLNIGKDANRDINPASERLIPIGKSAVDMQKYVGFVAV